MAARDAGDIVTQMDDLLGPLSSEEYISNTGTLGIFTYSFDRQMNGSNNASETSEHVDQISMYIKIPIASAMIFVSIITFLGNSLVIYAIKTERRLQTVSNHFICSLAVADTMIGIFVMPMSIIYFIDDFQWNFGLVLCQMWLSVDYVSSTSSILNLFILSLDRYWSVRNPLKYMRKRTGKRAALMISIVWCLACTWIIAIVFWHKIMHNGVRMVPPTDCDTEFYMDQYFKVITALVNFYIPMILMTILYGKIYREIRKRSQMEIGKINTARTCNSRYHNSSAMQAHLDAENGANEGLLTPDKIEWSPEYDSGSSSRNTSGDSDIQTDSLESSRLSDRRKPKLDNQLRCISQMAFVTTGIAGFIQYPDGTANDVASRYFPINGNSHVPTLKQVQEVSYEGEISQSEHNINSDSNDSNRYNSKENDSNSSNSKHERIPLRDIKSAPETPPTPLVTRKSILRATHSCGDSDIIKLPPMSTSERKISFSLERSPRNRRKASCDELVPLKKGIQSIEADLTGTRRSQRYKNRIQTPTDSLPNGHTTLTRTSCDGDSDMDSHNSLLSHFKVSFARFSVRKNRTKEVLANRIKRFSVNREKKAVKQLGIIVGCFVTCWLPYFVSFLIVAFKPEAIPATVHYALIWLGYLNSTFNPFIYPLCNSNFRKAFRRILRIPTT